MCCCLVSLFSDKEWTPSVQWSLPVSPKQTVQAALLRDKQQQRFEKVQLERAVKQLQESFPWEDRWVADTNFCIFQDTSKPRFTNNGYSLHSFFSSRTVKYRHEQLHNTLFFLQLLQENEKSLKKWVKNSLPGKEILERKLAGIPLWIIQGCRINCDYSCF